MRRPSAVFNFRLIILSCIVISVAIAILYPIINKKFQERSQMQAPIANRISHISEIHGDQRTDYYHWLRDDSWPNVKDKEVLDYLKEENKYLEAQMADQKELSDSLFLEMKSRIQENDQTVPYKDGPYYYYSRIKEGQQYWVHLRKGADDGKEEVALDENKIAEGKAYSRVSVIAISPDHKALLYLADFAGDERYSAYVMDIATNEIIDEKVSDIKGNVVWDELGKGFFYTPAGENWRSKEVFYHALFANSKDDKLIYKEEDETFSVGIGKSASKKYIMLRATNAKTNEFYFLDATLKDPKLRLFEPRRENHLYYPVHHKGVFYVLTNDIHENFRLVKTDELNTESANWKEVIPPSDSDYLVDLSAYDNHLVLSKSILGLTKIQVMNLTSGTSEEISFPDPVYEAYTVYTTFDAEGLRYSYSSLATPDSVMELSFEANESKVLKERKIPSGYDKNQYQLERVWAESKDGAKVPISLIYKKDLFKNDGSNPLYLYGYGSYGASMPTNFRISIFSLLDRGFIYAIAHIRGGDELGRKWYKSAKFLTKKRTFEDFIASAEYLSKGAEKNYTSAGNIVISGGSAGGMLMGVCANVRPDLYKSVVAHVPFVDVLNTMLDDTLPLTPGEFVEWGNPKEKEFYDYIKSYSPYDNVLEQNYPNILVTAGISDPRVTYWEPAKWVAEMRHKKTDNNLLLLKTNMDVGHSGPTGRFEYLKEVAMEYTFILKTFSNK